MDLNVSVPQKSLFKIDEVCSLTGVKPYVLRFWEAEFEEITPFVSSSGQKLYELKDIEAILTIKKLLFEEKLTIEKSKLRLKEVLLGQKEKSETKIEIEEKAVLVDSSFTFIEENVKTEAPIEKEKELETKQSRIFDKENLYWARQRLQEIISLTGAIKEKHHWV